MRSAAALIAAVAVAAACAATAGSAQHRTIRLGWTYVVRGETGFRPGAAHRAVGLVVVRGRWRGGHWHVVTTTRTDAHGRYRFAVKPARRGILTLRITPPDRFEIRIVVRVV